MANHKLYPRRDGTAFESLQCLDLILRHVFQRFEHLIDGQQAKPDLPVAMIAWLKGEIKGRDGVPKARIIHRCKPLLNILYVSEFFHLLKIAQRDSSLQIVPQR